VRELAALATVNASMETHMPKLEVGQEVEFIAPASADGRVIPAGTRARVELLLSELPEDKVFLVTLNEASPRTLIVARHVVTLHCQVVAYGCL